MHRPTPVKTIVADAMRQATARGGVCGYDQHDWEVEVLHLDMETREARPQLVYRADRDFPVWEGQGFPGDGIKRYEVVATIGACLTCRRCGLKAMTEEPRGPLGR